MNRRMAGINKVRPMNMRVVFIMNWTGDTCGFVHHVLIRLQRILGMEKVSLGVKNRNRGKYLLVESNTLGSYSSILRFLGSSCTWSLGMDESSFPFPSSEGPTVEMVVSFRGLGFWVVLFLLVVVLEGVFGLVREKIKVFSLSYELSTLAITFAGFGLA